MPLPPHRGARSGPADPPFALIPAQAGTHTEGRARQVRVRALLIPCLAMSLAACSGSGVGLVPEGTGSAFSERVKAAFFGGDSAGAQSAQASLSTQVTDCPPIDVRRGASTVTVHGPGEQVGTNVRYQASVGQTARECALLGATMTMKVGVQGRIILGPVGGPGRVEVPLRMAVVQEGPEPKTIWTRLYRVPVTIPPGQTNVPFVHIEEDLTFANPKPGDLESYIVYVGFDQAGMKEQKPQRSRRTRSAR